MKVWVIISGKEHSFTSVHLNEKSAREYKKELEQWSNSQLDLRIIETILKS